MESASRSGRGFLQEDEEDDGSSRKDGKNEEQNHPSTPRSKHSATEQRRRCKINDRFQILRDLIPHGDQKRDKASFLLEVIEYTRFLQEKVQKYESYPDMPWVKTFFRSLWKNAQSNAQGSGDGPAVPEFMFSANDNNTPAAPAVLSNLSESELNLFASVGRGIDFTQQRLISDSNNGALQSESQWLRPCTGDDTVNNDMLDEQELLIDEGTINMSHSYSQGLLATLTQSLESSGLDLSEASISVQISLGKRVKRPSTAASNAKEPDDASFANQALGGSSGEESDQVSKRHKSDHNNS